MNRIKYIGFYNHNSSKINRTCALSAVNKMDYVISSLNEIGYGVDIISPSWLNNNENRFFKGGETKTLNKNKYIYCPSFNSRTKVLNYITILLSWIWLFFYLLFNTKKGEKIIIYHSLWISIPLYYIKKIKKIHFVLEIEEIYSEIWKFPKLLVNYENKIINNSDSYIIASDLLKNKLSQSKEKVILYGAYKVNHDKEIYSSFDDRTYIHLVYAGGIERIRRGAFISIDILEYLPDNYFLNIVGFGEDKDINCLKECINSSSVKNRIKFHGEMKGKEFLTFLNQCDVGLNPQLIGNYMDTAFPSKILTYLSAGLNVISSKVDSIYCSKLKDEIFFYDKIEDVVNFKIHKVDSLVVSNLHKKFKKELSNII